MHKILDCSNLIGDSLYLLKPVMMYLQQYPGECVALTVLPQLGGDIVRECFRDIIPIYGSADEARQHFPDATVLVLNAGHAMSISYQYHMKHNQVLHISQAFGSMLGVHLDEVKPLLHWLPPKKDKPKSDKPLVMFSPFSHSCTSHSGKPANKSLSNKKWEHINRFFRSHDYDVQVVGPSDFYMHSVSIPLSSYRTGENLHHFLSVLQEADLIISIDNGIGHLAAALEIPTIIFWSNRVVPPAFIAPIWSKSVEFVLMDNPNTILAATLLYSLRTMLGKMEREKEVIVK